MTGACISYLISRTKPSNAPICASNTADSSPLSLPPTAIACIVTGEGWEKWEERNRNCRGGGRKDGPMVAVNDDKQWARPLFPVGYLGAVITPPRVQTAAIRHLRNFPLPPFRPNTSFPSSSPLSINYIDSHRPMVGADSRCPTLRILQSLAPPSALAH